MVKIEKIGINISLFYIVIFIPPISTWGKYLQAGIMKMHGIEPVCHTVGSDCNRRRIYVSDILEGNVQLQSQHIQEAQNTEYQDEAFNLEGESKQLSMKEAVQLMWHSFRLSQGDMALQFTMLYMAHSKFETQHLDQNDLEKEFRKMLGVGESMSQKNTGGKKEFKLSKNRSHDEVIDSTVDESSKKSPFFSMLVSGKGHMQRSAGRDGMNYISTNRHYLLKGKCIENIFERDFGYLLKTKDVNGRLYQPFGFTWDKVHPGRPNRDDKNDGSNNLKDRYFSYFVWYIVKNNQTGNEFFDEYFGELHSFFSQWFRGLPTDSDLEESNRLGWENERFYNSLRPHRASFNNPYSSRYFRRITKEDVLLLVAMYNATHPETQVEMRDLGLAEDPSYPIK